MSIIWFDNAKVFSYFLDDYTHEKYRIFNDKIFYNKMNKMYNLVPDLADFQGLKKRTELLSDIYGDQYAQSLLYWHITLNKFIRLSIPINRLSYLLNDTFLYFESFLHFKTRWHEGIKRPYRDHTLHTTGEAYLGVEFLLNNKNIRNSLKSFIKDISHKTGRFFREFSFITEDNLDHLVYKTWLISSLFHDLGYVISFNKELSLNMRKFNPYSAVLFNNNFPSFEELQYKLGNSLLFRTVDHDYIKKSFDENNHGVYSALLLLLTYYSPPAFDGVSHDDRIAIELAARSIFFHDFPGNHNDNIHISRKKEISDQNFIKLSIIDLDSQILDLIKSQMGKNSIIKCEKIDFNFEKDCNKIRRVKYPIDPFSFFLRFIDELHVFGRSQLSFVETKHNESIYSFKAKRIRNLVRFPAQIVKFTNENRVQVYYLLDNNLIKGNLCDKDCKEWLELKKGGIKFFLKELFWLKNRISHANDKKQDTFPEVDFYLVYV